MQEDYSTDGSIGEGTLEWEGRCRPQAGDEIDPLLGILPNATGKNPDGIPQWFEWWDQDDTIDLTTACGDLTNAMACGGGIPRVVFRRGDVDANGQLRIGDAIDLLDSRLAGGPPPRDPGPIACGPDPTADPWPEASREYPRTLCPEAISGSPARARRPKITPSRGTSTPRRRRRGTSRAAHPRRG